jgi:hypothetical protein
VGQQLERVDPVGTGTSRECSHIGNRPAWIVATPRCARCAPVTRKDSGRAEMPVDFDGLRAAVTDTLSAARRAGSRREPAR